MPRSLAILSRFAMCCGLMALSLGLAAASSRGAHAAVSGKALRVVIPPDMDPTKLTILCGKYGHGLSLGPIDTSGGAHEYQIDLHQAKSVKLLIYHPGYRMVTAAFDTAHITSTTAFTPQFVGLPMVPLQIRLVNSRGDPLVGEGVVLRHTLREMEYFGYRDGMVFPALVATAATDGRGEAHVEVPALLDDPYFARGDSRRPVAFEVSLPRHRGGAYGADPTPSEIPAQVSYPEPVTIAAVNRGRVSGRITESFAAKARADGEPSGSYTYWFEATMVGTRTGTGTRANADGTFAMTLRPGTYNLIIEARRNNTKPVSRLPVMKDLVLHEGEHRVLKLP